MMDCRETQTMLAAFHDGELPAADRVRVEEHLRDCRACAALLADLARVDRAAGVPDPGPAYWDRFNARVMDRVEREADGPKVATLRPKQGWMRQQFRYLAPAAAAAALVVVVVRYGGMVPVAPTRTVPLAVSAPAAPVSPERRMAEAEPAPRATNKAGSTAAGRRVPSSEIADERLAAITSEDRDRPPDRSSWAWNEASRDRATAGSPPLPAEDGFPSRMQAERKKMEGEAVLTAKQEVAGKAKAAAFVPAPSRAPSPCELARTLADRERFREAETAQRACLAGDLPDPARETGLLFLAELLDRQARFADADAVIAEVDRRFPQSRPLDLYRRQRSTLQK